MKLKILNSYIYTKIKLLTKNEKAKPKWKPQWASSTKQESVIPILIQNVIEKIILQVYCNLDMSRGKGYYEMAIKILFKMLAFAQNKNTMTN